jgi:putative CocE/NonD family hydrolase
VDGIAVNGYSEGSFQSKSAMATNPPGLDLVVSAIGTLSRSSRGPIGVQSGGRISWGGDRPEMPTSWTPIEESRSWSSSGEVVKQASNLKMHINDRTGWFDFAVQGAIDEWVALKDHGKATLIMGIGGHGALSEDSRQAPAYGDCDILFPEIDAFKIMRGENIPQKSRLFYFLMGDATNPQAPGNLWKVTESWPVPHQDQSWYFNKDGTLSDDKPTAKKAFTGYTYDPNDPVFIVSGARLPASQHGPRDHSILKDRNDILRFDSEPLADPVEITGEANVDLYFSTDVPDTCFVLTLVDINPDGYEWPIRDTAMMARYHKGLESPERLEEGNIYHAKLPLVATALVVDKGHRIGVRISSSSFPAYAIHPNTWDAIDSYDKAKVAKQRIYTSGKWASRLTLPVVAPGISIDYDPKKTY